MEKYYGTRPSKNIYEKISSLKRYEDCSSKNYYTDAIHFTHWVNTNLSNKITDDQGNLFLEINSSNNPEDETSLFAGERREVIKTRVQDTLDTSIMQYIKVSGEEGLKVIQISEEDWDQVVRNVSMISFFQGVPIGLKYYNNYAIATSTTNNEFINKDEIYFCINGDTYYHSAYTNETISGNIIGYRNTDYIRKSYTLDGNTQYYYLHDHQGNNNSELACYNCVVGTTQNASTINTNLQTAYYQALGRERYVQNKNVKYVNGELKGDLNNFLITYYRNRWNSRWIYRFI